MITEAESKELFKEVARSFKITEEKLMAFYELPECMKKRIKI